MALTDTELRTYDSQVLRLPTKKRTEYHQQVDRLIDGLRERLKDQDEVVVTRVVKAGSFAKHTILRPTYEDKTDVDVVFYLCGKSLSSSSLEDVTQRIYDILIEMYPTKKVEDFEIQRKAATVKFVGSSLYVDVVPVIRDEAADGYGWQYDLSDGTRSRTCAPGQIKFVKDRKDKDKDFRTLVRMGKRWRTHHGLTHLKSFTVELVMAYLLDRDGPGGSIEARFRKFLLYIADSGLKEHISFSENGPSIPVFDAPVVIVDPVCDTNNVAARITEAERAEIVAVADESWELACHASKEDDLDLWKELFGPRFNVEATA